MQASLASVSKARVVAVLLTAASPVLGSFGASAQQTASADPNNPRCELIQDRVARSDCLDASIAASKARIKAADEKTAAHDKSIAASKKAAAVAGQELVAAEKSTAASKKAATVAGQELVAAETSVAASNKSIETDRNRMSVGLQAIAASEAVAVEARKEEACGKQLIELAKTPELQAKGRLALTTAGMGVAQFGACKLVRHLTAQ